MGQLDGKVAIITGGGSGIGKGIAELYAAEGCSVVLAGRKAERLEAAAEAIRAAGGIALAHPADVSQEDQVAELFAHALQAYGRLDIVVNSAGAFDGGWLEDIPLSGWQNVVNANLTGPFLCIREAFRIMKPAGGGRIINIGSISAQRSRERSAPYAATKFGVWGLTQAAALEGRDYGIAVSALHPGNTMVERRARGQAEGRAADEEPMFDVEVIARTALLMVTLPPEANMLEAIVLPLEQKYIGRG
ncbi:MAG: SDR family oxidoreductase [Anaerolineae bacterium]|jgi:NAD(P)-dependent dehydrogenase (short-subunit alcohol dehydrogenase family)|nr:SDR family oxidoreductase [Chloroflexota bacterium]